MFPCALVSPSCHIPPAFALRGRPPPAPPARSCCGALWPREGFRRAGPAPASALALGSRSRVAPHRALPPHRTLPRIAPLSPLSKFCGARGIQHFSALCTVLERYCDLRSRAIIMITRRAPSHGGLQAWSCTRRERRACDSPCGTLALPHAPPRPRCCH